LIKTELIYRTLALNRKRDLIYSIQQQILGIIIHRNIYLMFLNTKSTLQLEVKIDEKEPAETKKTKKTYKNITIIQIRKLTVQYAGLVGGWNSLLPTHQPSILST